MNCLDDLRRAIHAMQLGPGTHAPGVRGLWLSIGTDSVQRPPCAIALQVHVTGTAAGRAVLVGAGCDPDLPDGDLLCVWLEVQPEELDTLAFTEAAGDGPELEEIVHGIARLLAMDPQGWERRVLAPLLRKELVIALLRHPDTLRTPKASPRRRNPQKLQAVIDWLSRNFDQPLPITSLARMACMSPLAFHQRFREATGLSPVQFVKETRLRQAHHLMVAGLETAASVAYRVGYGSPSHFSRDYARAYGLPPVRHVAQLLGDRAR